MDAYERYELARTIQTLVESAVIANDNDFLETAGALLEKVDALLQEIDAENQD